MGSPDWIAVLSLVEGGHLLALFVATWSRDEHVVPFHAHRPSSQHSSRSTRCPQSLLPRRDEAKRIDVAEMSLLLAKSPDVFCDVEAQKSLALAYAFRIAAGFAIAYPASRIGIELSLRGASSAALSRKRKFDAGRRDVEERALSTKGDDDARPREPRTTLGILPSIVKHKHDRAFVSPWHGADGGQGASHPSRGPKASDVYVVFSILHVMEGMLK